MLQPGTRVTAYWTHEPYTYQAEAVVAWVSDDHITVQLSGPVTASGGAPAWVGGTAGDYVCFSRYVESAEVRCDPSAADKT
jgi:hypothetical protein